MSESTQTTHNVDPADGVDDLHARLRRLWRRGRSFHSTRALCRLLTWLVAAALALLALDWSLELPGWARALLALAVVILLVRLVHVELLRRLRPYDPARLALQVETAHPKLNSVLISSVQFARGGMLAGASPSLIRAVQRSAARECKPLDFGAIVRFDRLRRPAGIAAVAAVALLVVGIAWPGHLWAMTRRMVNPFSTVRYPTRTRIDVLSGDMVVRQGARVELAARASGEVPDDGVLWVRSAGSSWEAVPVARRNGGEFRYVIARVHDNLEYSFHLGDARSLEHEVSVARPPHVVESVVSVQPPAYTGQAPEEVRTRNLKVPEGSLLGWVLKTDRPVDRAELLIEGAGTTPMSVGDGGRTLTLDTPAEASGAYRVRLHWTLAGRSLVEEGPKHFLDVRTDESPVVRLTWPGEDVRKATLHKTLRLRYWARDNYGLSGAWLKYRIDEGTWRRLPIAELAGRREVRDGRFDWVLSDALPNLREGEILTFLVEVADGREEGNPERMGASSSRRIQFVSEEDYLNYSLARRRRFLGRIRPLYRQQRQAGEQIERMQDANQSSSSVAEGDR
jgi:hypothetical protein